MKRLDGELYLLPGKLYFICTNQSSALGTALVKTLGGAVGSAIAIALSAKPGEAPTAADLAALDAAVAQHPGSLVMPAAQLELKDTLWWRSVRCGDQKFGLPSGFAKPLKAALSAWIKENSVKAKGFG